MQKYSPGFSQATSSPGPSGLNAKRESSEPDNSLTVRREKQLYLQLFRLPFKQAAIFLMFSCLGAAARLQGPERGSALGSMAAGATVTQGGGVSPLGSALTVCSVNKYTCYYRRVMASGAWVRGPEGVSSGSEGAGEMGDTLMETHSSSVLTPTVLIAQPVHLRTWQGSDAAAMQSVETAARPPPRLSQRALPVWRQSGRSMFSAARSPERSSGP
ncbi:hypothetical protein AAFF_G00388070 [Aldrovandia affinis]|uniref:Uncharacterized protein n=1 Tax=Aldrovandia affinis TaxID=143900 RepID=A0AAD7SEQ0_9TELE|nr:hypothetical protein AAFF_G00388070 [Aldrovandia affinis]